MYIVYRAEATTHKRIPLCHYSIAKTANPMQFCILYFDVWQVFKVTIVTVCE